MHARGQGEETTWIQKWAILAQTVRADAISSPLPSVVKYWLPAAADASLYIKIM